MQIETSRQADRQTDTWTDRQADRKKDSYTNRYIDRQTDIDSYADR